MSTPMTSHSPTSVGEDGGGFVAEVTALKARHEAECRCLTATMKNRTQRGIGVAFEKLAQAHKDRERLLTMVGAYNGRFEGPQAPIIAAEEIRAIPPEPIKTKVVKKVVKKFRRSST